MTGGVSSKSRRIKILKVSRELFAELFRQDCQKQIVFEGMPEDAKIAGISDHVYFDSDHLAIKVESDSFPEIFPWSAVPNLLVTVTEVRPEARRLHPYGSHYDDLETEIARLRQLNVELAERIAAQSELLSRKAEQP